MNARSISQKVKIAISVVITLFVVTLLTILAVVLTKHNDVKVQPASISASMMSQEVITHDPTKLDLPP